MSCAARGGISTPSLIAGLVSVLVAGASVSRGASAASSVSASSTLSARARPEPRVPRGLEEVGPQDAAALPTVSEIVERTNWANYYKGNDRRSQVEMLIKDPGGAERTRRLTILRRDATQGEEEGTTPLQVTAEDCGEQSFYVYFHRPADVNKTAFLVHKHLDANDDRWLYLPALDLVKRIAASDDRTSFVGSDFFYEDISGRNTAEDHHELQEITDNYYVLRNTPKDPSSVEFASFVMWIHKTTYLPVKTQFFDAAGTVYREFGALEVKTVQGYPTVVKAQMKDLRAGSETVVTCSSVTYNVGLTEDLFTERYLRNAPTKYLR